MEVRIDPKQVIETQESLPDGQCPRIVEACALQCSRRDEKWGRGPCRLQQAARWLLRRRARPSFSVGTPSPAVHLTLPGIRGWTAGVFRKCPTTVRGGRLRSVLQGRTSRLPVLAPRKDLLQPISPRRHPQRLRRRGRRPPGDPPAEVGPQRCDHQVIVQLLESLRYAPGAATEAGQEVPQPGIGMVDGEQRVGAVASSRGRMSVTAESPAEQDATYLPVGRLLIRLEDDRRRPGNIEVDASRLAWN